MRNNVVKMARLKHELKARSGVCLLLHVADADSGWRAWRVAHCRASVLLRQHQAVRAGDGKYTGGAGASQEDGSILGRVCRNRKPEHTGLEMVTYRSGNEQDDDLG